jgi:dihydrodipicolinate synthase/N-acetylneuraminate lyase
MSPRPLRGYFPIMPTAYAADGGIDLASMRRLTAFLITHAAQGMAPNGGDSEARYLTSAERMAILDAVLETSNGRTPVLVGASAPTTEESAALVRHAERAGADGVFVMPPANWTQTLLEPRVPDEDMLRHYATICEGVDIPLMIHATAAMDVPFLQDLIARIPNVRYIKEETTYGPTLRRYVRELGDRVVVFGPGLHYPAELAWGAQGVMPSCCAPASHARVFDLWQRGEHEAARATWNRMLPLVFWRWRTAPQEAGKLYLRKMGVFSTTLTRPAMGPPTLEDADLQELECVLATMGDPV